MRMKKPREKYETALYFSFNFPSLVDLYFLVADTRLCKPLFGPLVRMSRSRFSRFSAPAHPSATNAAQCIGPFFPPSHFFSIANFDSLIIPFSIFTHVSYVELRD